MDNKRTKKHRELNQDYKMTNKLTNSFPGYLFLLTQKLTKIDKKSKIFTLHWKFVIFFKISIMSKIRNLIHCMPDNTNIGTIKEYKRIYIITL